MYQNGFYMPDFQQNQPMQQASQNPYYPQFKQYNNNPWQMSQQSQFGQMNVPQQVQNLSPTLSGRYINQPKDIAANEVPMDGTVGFFPTNDQQYIYAKAWNADGKIETGVYKLVQENAEENNQVNNFDLINERLERIEKLLSTKTTSRKKVEEDE